MSSEALSQSFVNYCDPGTWDLHIKLVDEVRGLEPSNVRKSHLRNRKRVPCFYRILV